MEATPIFNVDILRFRHEFMLSLRKWLDAEGFIEIETPFLIEANTPDPHIDPVNVLLEQPSKHIMQLRTSPEIWLKKALSLGLPKIYELARVFRDDPKGPAHHKEFTMLEWYRTEADLLDLEADCEGLFSLAVQISRKHFGNSVSDPASFEKASVRELFQSLASLDLDSVLKDSDPDALQKLLSSRGEYLPKESSFMDAFFHVMIKYIEPNLNKEIPTVITRWPLELAALAAPCADDPHYCERFEIYYQGLEIANAYQECVDKEVLEKRFKAENAQRKKLGKEQFIIDYAFLDAIATMPKTAGIAMGIDRLLQSVLQIKHLKELILGF